MVIYYAKIHISYSIKKKAERFGERKLEASKRPTYKDKQVIYLFWFRGLFWFKHFKMTWVGIYDVHTSLYSSRLIQVKPIIVWTLCSHKVLDLGDFTAKLCMFLHNQVILKICQLFNFSIYLCVTLRIVQVTRLFNNDYQ